MEQTTSHTTRKILTGKVVSEKMKDTVVVLVETFQKAPKYGKYLTKSKKFKAHNPGNTKHLGETVRIEECKPISKDKHFKVIA